MRGREELPESLDVVLAQGGNGGFDTAGFGDDMEKRVPLARGEMGGSVGSGGSGLKRGQAEFLEGGETRSTAGVVFGFGGARFFGDSQAVGHHKGPIGGNRDGFEFERGEMDEEGGAGSGGEDGSVVHAAAASADILFAFG